MRCALDPAVLEPLHEAGRYREVVDRVLALPVAESRDADPLVLFLAASSAARLGLLERASDWAERALEGFLMRGDEQGALRATNLMGAVDFEFGRIHRAELRFVNARRLARQLGDRLMAARTTNNLANIAHLRGQVEKALRLYRAALNTFEAVGDCRGAAETLHNLALRFRQLGALRDAGHAADQAVLRAERCGLPALLALCLAGSAEIAMERQDYSAARRQLDRAEELMAQAGDRLLGLEARRLRARIALASGQAESAQEAAAAVRSEAEAQGIALVAAEATAIRSLALRSLRRLDDAAAERERALEAFTRLGANDLLERFELDWEETEAADSGVA